MGLEGFGFNRRRFRDLSEQEVLALAISSEEDDARIYRSYAERLRADYPDSAAMFDEMAAEEDSHRQRLIELHRARFGEVIPLIRREHVAGYYARRPVWLVENLGLDRIRDEAAAMEQDAEAFYLKAAATHRMPPPASFWAISPGPRPATAPVPTVPPRRIWTPMPARRRTTARTGSSC
jgi:rubrerythrin